MPHPTAPTPPTPPPVRRHVALSSAMLAAGTVAGTVWLLSLPALTLMGGRAEGELADSVAALRLAEAAGRLTASMPLLAEAGTAGARAEAVAGLRSKARDLGQPVAALGRSGLPRATVEGLRRPLSGVEGEIDDLDQAVEARIAAEASLHNALAQVPERQAVLQAALRPTGEDGLHDAIAERAQRLAGRLLTDGSQDAFRTEARALEALLTRLPIGAAGVGHTEAARRLVALGLDAGNVFELRQEVDHLKERIAGLLAVGRARTEDVSALARRTADGARSGLTADRTRAVMLLRAAPLLAGILAALAVVVAAARRTGPPAPAAPVEPEERSSGLRILLAEDEAMTRTVAIALLRRAGHEVTAVKDGAAALDMAAAQDFDLLLLDLRMPVMDGVEALRRIRALPDRSRARVRAVVLTASPLAADAERCRAAGADAVLPKPLRLDALLPVLEGAGAAPPGEEEAVFDPDALAQMLDALPPERVGALIGGTLKTLDDYRATLRDAWSRNDGAAASAMAHKVAGVAGVYGCRALRQAAQALERALESGEGDAAALMNALETAYPPALAALERERWKLPSPAADVR